MSEPISYAFTNTGVFASYDGIHYQTNTTVTDATVASFGNCIIVTSNQVIIGNSTVFNYVNSTVWTGSANVNVVNVVPGGSNTNIQFNNSGSFGGNDAFTYNTGLVTVGNSSVNTTINSSSITTTLLTVGNSTVNTVVNSTLMSTLSFGTVNKLRNSSLSAWFHGTGSLTITTSGGWGAEGIYIVPTGANVTAQQISSSLSPALSFWAQKITGNTSVTDVTVRFVVESYEVQPLVGKQVTFQVPVLNNTGGTITPTITVKHAAAQDATYTNVDVSAVSLQSITNGSTGVLSYSWVMAAGSGNGLSINIDFGNNFSTNGKSIQIGGGFDLRATPSATSGTIANPPIPEIRNTSDDIAWCMRFYETSYDNGTAPGTATRTGLADINVVGDGSNKFAVSIPFKVQKRATATVSTWDGAGTAGFTTRYLNGTYNDAIAGGSTVVTVGMSSFVLYPNFAAQNHLLVHFAADATLTGA